MEDRLLGVYTIEHLASFPQWHGRVLDVKSAFLNAPGRSAKQEEEHVIIVRPPCSLVSESPVEFSKIL